MWTRLLARCTPIILAILVIYTDIGGLYNWDDPVSEVDYPVSDPSLDDRTDQAGGPFLWVLTWLGSPTIEPSLGLFQFLFANHR